MPDQGRAALEYICRDKLKGEERKQALCFVAGTAITATVYELLDTKRKFRSHDADKVVSIIERFSDGPGVDNSQVRKEFSEAFYKETGIELASWLHKNVKGPKLAICQSILSNGHPRDLDLLKAAFEGFGKTNTSLIREVLQDKTHAEIVRIAHQYDLGRSWI